jgi:hypothetical protein
LNPTATILRCRQIAGNDSEIDASNFLDLANTVRDKVREWPQERLTSHTTRDFLESLRRVEDDFLALVEADPMMLYRPAHAVAQAFHESEAFIRYFKSGNRCGKSQTGYTEHYRVATGQTPDRQFLPPPTASFIVGVDFQKYAPTVFERKFITGEPNNPLSPMFPEGGKWLYKYDSVRRIIYIACRECAEAGKASSCKHPKSTITLFSDNGGPDVLQGAQYNLGHFDEHIAEELYNEAIQRLQTVDLSSFIVTGTPLHGKSSWESRKLERTFLGGPSTNRIPGTDRPYVSVHVIDQYQAGFIPKEKIEASKVGMTDYEIQCRIYGKTAALAKNPVFDRVALGKMEDKVVPPSRGYLTDKIEFKEHSDGRLNVWKEPTHDGQYIIGSDVAAGLVEGDYSCASVLQLPGLELVAQFHGHLNPLAYAQECAYIGEWYNMALMVVERTGGLGVGTITKLKEIGYWNIFRDLADPSAAQYAQDAVLGIDTNIRTKSQIIACLQQLVLEEAIEIHCAATIEEMYAFTQEYTPQKMNVRLKGEAGEHDDRVMSLALAGYVAITYPVYEFNTKKKEYTNDQQTNEIWKGLHQELEQNDKMRRDPYGYSI